jgi:serine/threonine protein kinase
MPDITFWSQVKLNLCIVGTGAYGIVVSAKDATVKDPERSTVAIKKIEKAFEHKVFMRRTLRELKALRLLKHENIMSIVTIQKPVSLEEFNDLYVVNELMETDLATIIKSPQKLINEHIQYFLYQILKGVKYIHSAKLLHRDIVSFNTNYRNLVIS